MTPHQVIALIPDACTSCMLCVRECPSWSISLDSHTEEVTEPGARRPRTVNVLDDFRIDYGTCMYCSICVEVCPFDALHWESAGDQSAIARTELVHDETRLSEHRTDQR